MLVLQQRVVVRADDLVAVLLVEERRLEAEGVEKNPVAASRPGFRLRRRQQARAVSVATKVRAHPEGLDPPATPPRPSMEAGGNASVLVADEHGQPSPVVEPCLLDVVGV